MAALSADVSSDLRLQTITYEGLASRDPDQMTALSQGLQRDGAVAISGIPNFVTQRTAFFASALAFSQLSEAQKQEVASQGTETTWSYLGYDTGKEEFVDEQGIARTDLSKSSYYMVHPDIPDNRWSTHVDLKGPCSAISKTMFDVSTLVMEAVGLIGEEKPLGNFEGGFGVGRMLHYTPPEHEDPNPLWCGAHEDHSLVTALLAPNYLKDGKPIPAPEGAGLEIKVDGVFRRAVVNPEHLILQVGDFGQLTSSDRMVATTHRVAKPRERVEGLSRHTYAFFVDPELEMRVGATTSVLTKDSRYKPGMTFNEWHLASLRKYEVTEEKTNPAEDKKTI